MGDPRGFLKVKRAKSVERPVADRVKDWSEITIEHADDVLRGQASRCMDCGIPFCHQGCPLGNVIPEFNDLVHRDRLADALHVLHSTNNFPEITGRVCPAPCEASCVLGIENTPVTIKDIERSIAHADDFTPRPSSSRTGRRIAVVGSGPAGMAVAQELARKGHTVVLFERDDRAGGLLRYGIPDFKLEKAILDKRFEQMRVEGVELRTSTSPSAADLQSFDATVLAMGARVARDLAVPGRELGGVWYAMDFLQRQNAKVAGDAVADWIDAKDKHVVVIGGGDTGSDCVGTSNRHGAKSVVQLELMPKPPLARMPENPWPAWPLVLRTSSSHEEGCEREFAIMTKGFVGEGTVRALSAVRVELSASGFKEVPGSEIEIPCDLALLAMGFTGPEKTGLVAELGLALDARGNIVTNAQGATNVPKVFAAGDANRGQSLVVWAIADGRRVAAGVDAFLRTARAA